MKKICLILSLAASTVLISACKSDNATPEDTAPVKTELNSDAKAQNDSDTLLNKCPISEPFKSYLVNTTWVPTFIKDLGDAVAPKGGEDGSPYVYIGKDYKVSGMSGDNMFYCTFVINTNGSFRTAQISLTHRSGRFETYEYRFLQAIYKADRISIMSEGRKMNLYYNGEIIASFAKAKNIEE